MRTQNCTLLWVNWDQFRIAFWCLGKPMHALPHLSEVFPDVAFGTIVVLIWLIGDDPFLSLQAESYGASSLYASLLQTISGVVFLAFCIQVMAQTPQHFISSEMQATWDGCLLSLLVYLLCQILYENYYLMYTYQAPHLEMSPKHLTVASI